MRHGWQMSKIVPGAVRRLAGSGVLAGALIALILQLFTSSMSFASDGTWIEICSDFGTEYVQVDLSDTSEPGPADCHDCFDCIMCATSMAALAVDSEIHVASMPATARSERLETQTVGVVFRRAWPETRGPPAAKATEDDCAQGAVTASFQENGGAL